MLCPDGKVAASIVHYICSRMVILCLCVPAVFSYNIYNRWLVSYDFHAFALPCFVGTFCLVLLEQRLYTARQCTEKVSLTVFLHLSLMGCLSHFREKFIQCIANFRFILSVADMDAIESATDPRATLEQLAVSKDLPVVMRSIQGEVRYCSECSQVKPDRAHHCSVCGQCVLKMDHHCPW